MDLDKKYRPKTLDKIIGHEAHVERLQGIIKSGNYPSSMLFAGPTSAGKTTLARAFVASLFGVKNPTGHPDFTEFNSADSRGIDDMRNTLRVARLRPRSAPRRVFLMDEAQGFTGDAARLLLKPLEEPPPGTIFILGSMEPEKLSTAMRNRCQPFILKKPTRAQLTKYVKRIIKGEGLDFMTEELTATVIENSDGQMRSAAWILQGLAQIATTKKVKTSDIEAALESMESSDDALAVEVLAAVYRRKLELVYRHLLDVQNGFQFISKLLTLNKFLISNHVLKGEKHRAVWFSKSNIEISKIVKTEFESMSASQFLALLSVVQAQLVDLKREAGSFLVNETDAVAYRLSIAIRAINMVIKPKD
jgi:DNA polymerase III gamma/tau subunit